LNLDPLGLLLMQSGTRLLFNTCDKTTITIFNFRISGGGGIVAGRGKFQPPLYETLQCVSYLQHDDVKVGLEDETTMQTMKNLPTVAMLLLLLLMCTYGCNFNVHSIQPFYISV